MNGASDFSSLLNANLSLKSQLPSSTLPAIHRNVAQLQQATNKLQRTQQPYTAQSASTLAPASSTALALSAPSSVSTSTAQLFLAKQGVNLTQQASYLSSLTLSQPQQPLTATTAASASVDLPTYLASHHSQLLEAVVRETNDEIDYNIERGYQEQMEQEWEREKRHILDTLGFRSANTASARHTAQPAYSTPAKGGEVRLGGMGGASNLTTEQQQYGVLVRTLNRRRLQHQPYPLVTAVRDASIVLSGVRGVSEVSELWSVVRYMVNEHDVADEQYQRLALTESFYRLQWTADTPALKEQLVGQAMRYCEELFLAHVRSTAGSVEQYAVNIIQQAAAGDRVRDYLGPLPVWPVAFYLLRAGAKQEAVTHVSKFNQQSPHSDVSVFLSCLQHFAQSSSPFTTLPPQLQSSLQEIYNRDFSQRAQSSVDPYKLALFTLLGRFSAPSGIDYMSYTAESTEAYLWYKLASLGSTTALHHFKSDIVNRGEAHFNADQQHALLYTKVLILTQCFEQAVRYLLKAGWRDLGVNALIVLRYYGLIREPQESGGEEMAVLNSEGLLCINAARMVEQYVIDTLMDDTELSFHYLYTLYPHDSSMYALARLLVAGTGE